MSRVRVLQGAIYIKGKIMEKLINSMKTYFRGVRTEWGKISWPEKQTVLVETGVVVFIVILFTAAVYVMDIIFKSIFSLIK